MHSQLISLLPFLSLLIPSTSSPLQRRGGDPSLPSCLYNQDLAALTQYSPPNPNDCQAAIDTVSGWLATLTQQGSTTKNPSLLSQNGTCEALVKLALVKLGNSGSPPAADACTFTFQSRQGCFQTTNQGYNSHQVGGTINIHFDDTSDNAPVDTDLPTYSFGNAGMFGGGASSSGPGGSIGGEGGESAAFLAEATSSTVDQD